MALVRNFGPLRDVRPRKAASGTSSRPRSRPQKTVPIIRSDDENTYESSHKSLSGHHKLREESDSDNLESESEPTDPADLDENLDYAFKKGDPVWIQLKGKWYHGKVGAIVESKKQPMVTLYTVFFRGNLKVNLTPVDGAIKPDTPRIRRLLRVANWL
ncbi:hypothetical protein WOLCODRAFT_134887 [Wolfiporia cocos MD-104 SS10]|uniref:Uncharacterized protein n=1 Tax=Wolfiporia cocos (strain MD-104) TaxID=742152 RepID=A0A2H3ISW5_WOLCO|nr:hypothetical protein WOLCODRAFT_134887 [Wolfiporia cocos MD-104 SS10]